MNNSIRDPNCWREEVRLDSWKSIANYVGRSCRTLQRWRTRYGFPIRRMGGVSSSVFAFTDELDTWLRSRPQAPD